LRRFLAALLLLIGSWSHSAWAAIHSAPIVIKGDSVKWLTHYPIGMYRLFRASSSGKAVVIPFQIDEINDWGDYVLPDGGDVTANTGTGIFDPQDELSFMGDDVGPATPPSDWTEVGKPPIVIEIKITYPDPNTPGDKEGAVYLGVYFSNAPPLSPRQYVNFDRQRAEVTTSRYRYQFDQKNWLVAKRVEMVKRGTEQLPEREFVPLIDSTTFFMKADLKYFLTVEASHRSIQSQLEAYKIGPIRSIIRISFVYNFLKLNFELGMYTEVSFFSNAVYLPAILYNPLDGAKNLNPGSGFYYGMALRENPETYKVETNMPRHKKSGILDFLTTRPEPQETYWITAASADRILYMEINPSDEMRKRKSVPLFYQENVPGSAVLTRSNDKPGELGSSPVNLALYFDMTKFSEGEHNMSLKLFFENLNDSQHLTTFRTLKDWTIKSRRVN